MFKNIRKMFSNIKVNRQKQVCNNIKFNGDCLIDEFSVCQPKILPPKFDSVADRLIADQNIKDYESDTDTQQLFLNTKRHDECTRNNGDILEQLKQLIQLLVTITSEKNQSILYNTSFLREIIYNISQDLNVILANLDIRIMLDQNPDKNIS